MNPNERVEIRLQNNLSRKMIDIFIRKGNRFVKEIEFGEEERYIRIDSSTSIDETAAQVLMDDLWSCGIRPTEGKGSAGSLKATEHHLNDFRKIVANQLGIEL